jgi:competence protein ComEA
VPVPSISRRRALGYTAALLVLLAVGGRLVADDGKPPTPPAGAALVAAEPARAPALTVHVVGAVRRPGLYRVADGSRIDDAIRKAGGPRPKAALELVNLAAPVADGQQVVVPVKVKGAVAAAPVGATATAGALAPPVSLGSATLEQLDALPGIGPVTAQKILDYRAANGAFSSVEELDAVPGIGPARLEQLKPLVTL